VPGEADADLERTLDARELRTLCLDLLGRPPLDSEAAEYSSQEFQTAARSLARSEGFWRNWYEEQLYFFLLIENFRPAGETFDRLPADLAAGRLNVREAIHRIALAPTFELRNPGADTFVTVVMEQLGGMKVQSLARELEIGKGLYDGRSGQFLGESGTNQADVVRIAIHHKSFASTYVAREYRRLVHAEAPRDQVAAWAAAFQRDPAVWPDQFVAWLESPAYGARLKRRVPLSNRLFVRSLFVDVLERPPTMEEEQRMRTALDGLADPLPLRGVLARLLVDSSEARAHVQDPLDHGQWVRDRFLRLLGREPSAGELQAFVSALTESDVTRPTALYALLTHAEYHVH
jgi:hypothetical protein